MKYCTNKKKKYRKINRSGFYQYYLFIHVQLLRTFRVTQYINFSTDVFICDRFAITCGSLNTRTLKKKKIPWYDGLNRRDGSHGQRDILVRCKRIITCSDRGERME